MARTTRQLSGAGKDKFLRSIVARVAANPAEAALIAEALGREITEVRVRRETWESTIAEEGREPAPPVPVDQVSDAPSSEGVVVRPCSQPVPEASAFDPYAFSAVAVLTRKGRTGLAQALDAIVTADDLLRLAQAQHLVVPDGLVDVALLREAVILAAERRVAERRAAAS